MCHSVSFDVLKTSPFVTVKAIGSIDLIKEPLLCSDLLSGLHEDETRMGSRAMETILHVDRFMIHLLFVPTILCSIKWRDAV
jgi:hypothetical protein